MWRWACGVSALLTLLLPTPAAAQRAAAIAATVGHADHRVDAGFGVERSSGFLVGVEARLDWSPRFALALTGRAGHLDAAAAVVDRDVAELDARAELWLRPWVALEGGVLVRTYSTILARQRWTIGRAGAAIRLPLSGGALHAVGRASLLPVVAVAGLPDPDLGIETAVGFAYARGRWQADLRFTLERCDFPNRDEQFATLTLGLGYRVPF